MSKAITINWSMTDPPLVAKSWSKVVPTATVDGDQKLEQDLECPAGSIALLRAAFATGLSRHQGWDEQDPAAVWAASIYKRGVNTRPAKQTQLAGSYDITFPTTAKALQTAFEPDAFYIVDSEVLAAWPQIVWPKHVYSVKATERNKSLATVAKIARAGKAANCNRWVGVGGGIVCDMAAFAAALAGRDITLFPTTLLAMADACVGGKTGVNFPPFGKNQLGRFYFPSAVVAAPVWLQTLPRRHLLSGVAECLKHAYLVGDVDLSERIVQASDDLALWTELLPDIVQIKADVVSRDAAEAHERATLNLGHTLAHALEAIAYSTASDEDQIMHGEAVALGLVYAGLLSQKVRSLPKGDLDLIQRQLTETKCLMSRETLEVRLGRDDLTSSSFTNRLLESMRHDKKASGTAIQFVTLEQLGRPYAHDGNFTEPVSETIVRDVWMELIDALTPTAI